MRSSPKGVFPPVTLPQRLLLGLLSHSPVTARLWTSQLLQLSEREQQELPLLLESRSRSKVTRDQESLCSLSAEGSRPTSPPIRQLFWRRAGQRC